MLHNACIVCISSISIGVFFLRVWNIGVNRNNIDPAFEWAWNACYTVIVPKLKRVEHNQIQLKFMLKTISAACHSLFNISIMLCGSLFNIIINSCTKRGVAGDTGRVRWNFLFIHVRHQLSKFFEPFPISFHANWIAFHFHVNAVAI